MLRPLKKVRLSSAEIACSNFSKAIITARTMYLQTFPSPLQITQANRSYFLAANPRIRPRRPMANSPSQSILIARSERVVEPRSKMRQRRNYEEASSDGAHGAGLEARALMQKPVRGGTTLALTKERRKRHLSSIHLRETHIHTKYHPSTITYYFPI